MNKVILMGRLTRDPEVRYSAGNNPMTVARYTLAVDRRTKDDDSADFIQCKAFDKKAEFAEKYLVKGIKVVVAGKIRTDSYKNKEGQTVHTFEVIVEECEFAESKSAGGNGSSPNRKAPAADGFMNIPEGIEEEFPFN